MAFLNSPRNGRYRLPKIVGGFVTLLAGLVLAIPGVPGPGIPLIVAGLLLLSDHFVWARRSLVWLKRTAVRLKQIVRKSKADSTR
jgi:hypothetical protein